MQKSASAISAENANEPSNHQTARRNATKSRNTKPVYLVRGLIA